MSESVTIGSSSDSDTTGIRPDINLKQMKENNIILTRFYFRCGVRDLVDPQQDEKPVQVNWQKKENLKFSNLKVKGCERLVFQDFNV